MRPKQLRKANEIWGWAEWELTFRQQFLLCWVFGLVIGTARLAE